LRVDEFLTQELGQMTIRRLLFSAIMLFGGAGVAHATLTVQTGNHPQMDD
jgi:hypothetical protein